MQSKDSTRLKTKTIITKANNPEFKAFYEFARQIVNVPKKEIDEQEKIYQANREKEKAKN